MGVWNYRNSNIYDNIDGFNHHWYSYFIVNALA